MKRSLFPIAQATRIFEVFKGKTPAILNFNSDLAIGFEIRIEIGRIGAEGWKQKTIQSPEVTTDRFQILDFFDAVDRSSLALIELLCGIQALDVDQILERFVA